MKSKKLGKIAAVTGWMLFALFAMMGISCGGLSLPAFLIAAVLVSPIFRNHVHLSGKVWIPLVVILFFAGAALSPQAEAGTEDTADRKASVASSEKHDKKGSDKEKQERVAKEQDKQEKLAQEQAEREEQEKLAKEQAEREEQAEQERIAQEQAAAQAEQERIAQEQAAQQAEQQRIAQEQAEAQANAGQNPFNTYNNLEQQQTSSNYVFNNNTMKFHYPSCRDVPKIAPENYAAFDGTRDDALSRGYSPCGHCNP